MKKFFAAAVALALACALSTAAFAETMETGTKQIDVIAKHNDGTTTATVYSVDVTWDDMTFIHNESGSKTWNPDTHTHTDNTTAGWNKTSAAIKVTNHSNAAVKATASYSPATGYESAGMSFGTNGNTIATAVGTGYDSAPNTTITVTPSGSLPESTNGKIGTITVTIEAAT